MNNEEEFKQSHKTEKEKHPKSFKSDKPIASVYKVIDNDLARDNLENDIPEADLQDL